MPWLWKTPENIKEKGNVKLEQMQLPVPWSEDEELEEIKKCALLLSDTAHFVQTGFKPTQIWCIPANNVNTVNMCLAAHKINWPEASWWLYF